MPSPRDELVEDQKQKKLETEKAFTIQSIAGNVFTAFVSSLPIDKSLLWLNMESLVYAISDAFSDIDRVGSYHSKTGANRFKKAAYIGKWIAEAKPIQLAKNFPLNLTNSVTMNSSMMNAMFAVFVIEALLGDKYPLYTKLRLDLRYTFVFRHRVEAISIAMLLEHALDHSRNTK